MFQRLRYATLFPVQGAKVAQHTASARDLSALALSLGVLPRLVEHLTETAQLAAWVPTDLCEDLVAEISGWIVEEPPLSLSEGGMIREGNHAGLDDWPSTRIASSRAYGSVQGVPCSFTEGGRVKKERAW